jgi:ABC-type bacteriocin/lantibiotic exporter with double-glycine peptidase domain
MNIELPLYGQEKRNTCALACLRMVLAAFGSHVAERDLEVEAIMEEDGTRIDELQRLATQHSLAAEIREVPIADLRSALAEGKLPIAYIDRAVFQLTPQQRLQHRLHEAKIHCVIPTHVTDAYVTFHDPLPPRVTRRSIALFRQAYERLGSYAVLCSPTTGQ